MTNLTNNPSSTSNPLPKIPKDIGFTVIALSFLVGFISFFFVHFYAKKTYISAFDLFQVYFIGVIITLLIPRKIIAKLRIIHYERIIVAFSSMGLLTTALFLVLNYHFSHSPKIRTYELYAIDLAKNRSGVYYKIKNPDVYLSEEYQFKIDKILSNNPTHIELTIETGLFGYEVEKQMTIK